MDVTATTEENLSKSGYVYALLIVDIKKILFGRFKKRKSIRIFPFEIVFSPAVKGTNGFGANSESLVIRTKVKFSI